MVEHALGGGPTMDGCGVASVLVAPNSIKM